MTEEPRPAGVSVLIGLTWAGAVLYALAAVLALLRVPGSGPDVLLGGPSWFYWLVQALMSGLMAVVFGWIARGLAARQDPARIMVAAVAAISLVFSLLSLSYGVGLATLVVSAVALFLATTRRTRDWFTAT